MPNVATLGLEFNSGDAKSKINDLCTKFDDLTKKCGSAQEALNKLATDGTDKIVASLGSALQTLKPIDSGTISSIKSFSTSLNALNGINLTSGANIETFFSSLNNVPNAEKLANFGRAISFIKPIRPAVTQSIGNLFTQLESFKRIPADNTGKITAMGNALSGFKVVSKRTVDNVKNLFAAIATFKPIPSSSLNSIRTMTDMFRAMSVTGTAGLGKVNNAAGSLSDSIGLMTARADAANIAFRSLTGAFSVRFLLQAAGDATRFGLELAYIKTLAQEYDTSVIGRGIMDFSAQLGTAGKNAKAFYYAYSAGMRGTEEDLLRFTEENAKLATVIRSDVIPTMNATTAAINAYGLGARDIGKVSDIFASIVKYGKASGEQLASGLGQVIPTAATAGLSLEELGASIASLTRVLQTRNAITYFNNMLSKMIKPTKATMQEAQKLGIELGLSALQAKGFAGVMQEIHDKTQGSHESLLRLFPDLRGQRAALQLLNKGWGDFQQQLVNFQNASGETGREFSVLANDINAQLQALPATFEKIIAEAGKSMLEIVTLNGALTPLIASFNNMGEGARSFFAILAGGAGVLGALKAGMLAWNTLRVLEIRNDRIINALKDQKKAKLMAEAVAQTRAAAATKEATAAEIAQYKAGAATTAMIAKKIRLQAEENAEKARGLSAWADSINAQLMEAKARGDNILAMRLEQQHRAMLYQVKLYDAKAESAVAQAIRTETVARTLNAQAAIAEAAAVKVSAGAKLKGMVSSATNSISVGVTAAVGGLGLMKAVPGATMLAGAIGALGPLMVTVGTSAFGMSTALTTTGGAITVTAMNATALTSALFQTSLSLAHPIASCQALGAAGMTAGVGAAGAAIAVGALVVGTAALGFTVGSLAYNYIPGLQRAMDALGESIYDFFTNGMSDANAKKSLVDLKIEIDNRIKEQIGTAAEAQKEVNNMWQNAAIRELTGLQKLEALQKRQAEAQKRLNINTLEAVRQKEQEIVSLRKVATSAQTSQAEAENYKKRIEKLSQELQKTKSAYIAANQEQIAVNKAVEDMKAEIRKSVETMRSIIDEQYYKMLTPADRRLETGDRFLKGVKGYYDARRDGNTKLAEEQVKLLTKNYDELYTQAQKRIADNKKTMENLQKIQMDTMIQTANTDAAKYAIYQQEQQRRQQEAMTKAAAGDYSGAAQAWQKSSEAAKQMISMQNKLADAEKKANESTQKMIFKLDKFKSTAAEVVDAYSVKAVELQSRRFDTIPTMNNANTMQNTANQLNQQLAQQTLQFIQQLQGKITADTQKTEQEQSNYDDIFDAVADSLDSNANIVQAGFQDIKAALSTTQFKVKIDSGLPAINSVRL